MSKANPLGLIASYGDSDEDSDDGSPLKRDDRAYCPGYDTKTPTVPPGIHPSPIPHCPWSACYDENSGFTYYWNQQTNAVTWEAPSEYLLALKLAQQQLTTAGSTEVSAEEWQLYQQALAEKQTQKVKPVTKSILKKPEKNIKNNAKKRLASDEEDEKIELITSYHNSDSESNDEVEKPAETPKPNKIPKVVQKKPKPAKTLEYGPPLPPNQNYTVPIGPELPLGLETKPPLPEEIRPKTVDEEVKLPLKVVDEDRQEEKVLLKELKDKAKILEKLGGELPSDLQQIIKDDPQSVTASPKSDKEALDIDVLLDEIEKKELPKIVKSKKDDGKTKSSSNSIDNSPGGDRTPPLEVDPSPTASGVSLFPSAANIEKVKLEKDNSLPIENQKKENVYLLNIEPAENVNRKRLRLSNSVLPDRKRDKIEVPAYTTKYAQLVEGFSTERTGLGFVKDEESVNSPKNTITYGNGLTFTKGETLNEEKKDEDLDDLTDLVEAKLKFLSQIQPCSLTPVHEMMIQMQTLLSSFRAGALSASYWRRWAGGARAALAAHEAAAAPPGWHCVFLRSEARYCYSRDADGFVQFEYPAVATTDMDICTTPPHDDKEETPSWRATPPPPGTDDAPTDGIVKKEIGDELQSFYNDIAEIEKSSGTEPNSPEPPPPPPPPEISERMKELREKRERSREREVKEKIKEKEIKEKSREKEIKMPKKKSKVKLSSSIAMKNRSVSHLVAKWQQVADEIHSD